VLLKVYWRTFPDGRYRAMLPEDSEVSFAELQKMSINPPKMLSSCISVLR